MPSNESEHGKQPVALRPTYADLPLLAITRSPSQDVAALIRSEPDLRHYVGIMVRRIWIIIAVVVVTSAAVTLYALRLPNIYMSTAVLRLKSPGEGNTSGQIAMNSYADYQYFQTQIELLRNPNLIRRAVLRHHLYLDPRLLGANGGNRRSQLAGVASLSQSSSPNASDVPDEPEDLTPQQALMLEPYVSSIQQGLAVSQKPDTTLINVSFSHTDSECAARVTTAITDTFIRENIKFETTGLRSALQEAGRQVTEIQGTIQQLEQQRIQLLRDNKLPLVEGQGRNLIGERLGQLSAQLLGAESERTKLEADCEAATLSSNIWSVPQIATNKAVQDERANLLGLEKRRLLLLQTYTDQWPEVKKLDFEIAQSKLRVETAGREALEDLKATYQMALIRERKLREAYEHESRAANDQSRNSIELTNVNQKIETSRQLYASLLQYQKKLELDSTGRGNNASLVSPALPSVSPVASSRWINVGVIILMSLSAGIGLAFLIEQFDSRLSSVDDVTTHLALQTVGMIPFHQRSALMGLLRRRRMSGTSALSMIEDTLSPAAEAFRNLRTSLVFGSQSAGPRIILITSGRQFEGKTTTSVNLAYAFAQTGADVLLIDCDLRGPQVHSHFGLSNDLGLTDCLTRDVDIDRLLFSHVEYSSLKVLTAGTMAANPSDFLNSGGMRELLERMRTRFAYVVIDSPPAIPFADAPLLSTMADATLVVVNSRRTSRRTVKRVKERLLQVGSSVSGVVLNYVESEKTDSYYYYRTSEPGTASREREAL